jgi:acyl-CoA reductase-like NAD-dependent aldehyde dehydrogenase
VAPSLAVGNTVVIKPSELAPLSSLAFAELVGGIVPAGVVDVVPGDGITAGAALAGHPGIDHLTFTGSVATGIAVSVAAARNVVATNLELGGKSAALVFPDADLGEAARFAAAAIMRNSGQSCSALTRFVVHESVRERFVELLVDRVSRLRVGVGRDDPDLGPIVSARQRDRVFGLIEQAADQGGDIRIGGAFAPEEWKDSAGFFASPTVVAGVRPDSVLATTEVFGPVQTVIDFADESEAVEIANGTPYGLTAAVFTADLRTAERVARRIRAGQVQINGFNGAAVEVPFGGYRHSGHGREKGFAALLGYTQVKAVVTHLG